MQIQRTGSVPGAEEEPEYTAWFLFGAMGSGKTTAISTFPAPLFLVPANEGSQLTLKDRGLDMPYVIVGRENGQPIPARRHINAILTDLEKRHRKMQKLFREAGKAETEEEADVLYTKGDKAFPWRTIGVESITQMADLFIEDITEQGRHAMDQQKWGVLANTFRSIHNRLRNMDVHIVYTALDKIDDKTTHGLPNIQGSTATKLPAACDVVGYCEEATAGNKSTYRVHFRRFGKYVARTRFNRMPRMVTNFNFGEVAKHIPGAVL